MDSILINFTRWVWAENPKTFLSECVSYRKQERHFYLRGLVTLAMKFTGLPSTTRTRSMVPQLIERCTSRIEAENSVDQPFLKQHTPNNSRGSKTVSPMDAYRYAVE